MEESQLGWLIAAAVTIGTAIAIGFRWRRAASQRSAHRRRAQRAAKAEGEAAELLRRSGYSIDAVQPAHTWQILVDGRPHAIDLRVDYLARRRGRRFAVEVKTGMRAPRIETSATRRQIIEYMAAYDVDGALLVDMEEREIHTVELPGRLGGNVASAGTLFWATVLAAGAGAAAAHWLL